VAHVVCELAMRLQAVDLARNVCFSIAWTRTDLAESFSEKSIRTIVGCQCCCELLAQHI
jgi:hypothetical protein